jgi:GntR family transcriptional repressor for pyruvate dehydrogenase complex
VVDVLMDLLRENRELSLQVEGRQKKSLAGHRRIFSALKRGNAFAAEAAMRRHLQEIETIVLKNL